MQNTCELQACSSGRLVCSAQQLSTVFDSRVPAAIQKVAGSPSQGLIHAGTSAYQIRVEPGFELLLCIYAQSAQHLETLLSVQRCDWLELQGLSTEDLHEALSQGSLSERQLQSTVDQVAQPN